MPFGDVPAALRDKLPRGNPGHQGVPALGSRAWRWRTRGARRQSSRFVGWGFGVKMS